MRTVVISGLLLVASSQSAFAASNSSAFLADQSKRAKAQSGIVLNCSFFQLCGRTNCSDMSGTGKLILNPVSVTILENQAFSEGVWRGLWANDETIVDVTGAIAGNAFTGFVTGQNDTRTMLTTYFDDGTTYYTSHNLTNRTAVSHFGQCKVED